MIYLGCDCGNDTSFFMWYNPGSESIAAQCKECEAIQVWKADHE